MEKLRVCGTGIAVGAVLLVPAGCGASDREFDAASTATTSRLGRTIQTVERQVPSPLPRRLPPAVEGDTEHTAGSDALGKVHQAATRFFSTYVRFLYGGIPPSQVSDVGAQLRSELRDGARLISPAERSSRPRLMRVTIVSSGPPISALATATLLDGDRRYRLTATLEPQHGSWAVVDVRG